MNSVLLVHPDDDMVVALRDHQSGDVVRIDAESIQLTGAVAAKHKFARRDTRKGDQLRMYGLVVAEAIRDIRQGEPLTTANLQHATGQITTKPSATWQSPDVAAWADRTFDGYHRPDGRVGTRNYWIVVPLVFCQNRNVEVLRESLVSQLGYARPHRFGALTQQLIELHRNGTPPSALRQTTLTVNPTDTRQRRLFAEVDGVKFLTHDGGCGGLYEDAQTLCGLLAGYINHPNVAGATVLSLGCQKSQIATLESELHKRNTNLQKPLFIFEQQQEGTEQALLEKALRHTFAGLVEASAWRREAASLRHLMLGVECGGSDGFSGISANPAIGHCSDLLVAVGGGVILSEFPELAGCESDLTSRCTSPALAERFLQIMRDYDRRATRDGGGFDHNPSPGNVRDGLITDAIKSAGAREEGGDFADCGCPRLSRTSDARGAESSLHAGR